MDGSMKLCASGIELNELYFRTKASSYGPASLQRSFSLRARCFSFFEQTAPRLVYLIVYMLTPQRERSSRCRPGRFSRRVVRTVVLSIPDMSRLPRRFRLCRKEERRLQRFQAESLLSRSQSDLSLHLFRKQLNSDQALNFSKLFPPRSSSSMARSDYSMHRLNMPASSTSFLQACRQEIKSQSLPIAPTSAWNSLFRRLHLVTTSLFILMGRRVLSSRALASPANFTPVRFSYSMLRPANPLLRGAKELRVEPVRFRICRLGQDQTKLASNQMARGQKIDRVRLLSELRSRWQRVGWWWREVSRWHSKSPCSEQPDSLRSTSSLSPATSSITSSAPSTLKLFWLKLICTKSGLFLSILSNALKLQFLSPQLARFNL